MNKDKELLLDPIRQRLQKQLERFFHKQRLMFMDKFEKFRDDFPEPPPELKEAATPPGITPDWEAIWDYIAMMTVGLVADDITEAVRLSMLKAGLASIGTVNIGMSFTLKNPKAVEYLEQYGARLVTKIDQTTKDGLKRIIIQATDEGWGYGKTSSVIREMFDGFSAPSPLTHIRNRAEFIAVTETGNAYESAALMQAQALQMAGLPMEKAWLITGGNICDDCQGNADEGWIPLDEPFSSGDDRPLAHPGCILPGNEIIPVGEISAATKSFYNGRAIEITLSGGSRITVTENHPIFTDRGWIKAGIINKRDYHIYSILAEGITASINPYYQQRPTKIEDKFATLEKSRSVSAITVPSSPKYFNGDGRSINGDINIIYTNGFLRSNIKSEIDKIVSQPYFNKCSTRLISLMSQCLFSPLFQSDLPANRGQMSGSKLVGSLVSSHVRPFNKFGFGLGARNDISLNESTIENTPANSNLAREFIGRFSGNVSLEDIIQVRDFNFTGHVYDLQCNMYELYICNGIITHNCRCALLTQWAREEGKEDQSLDMIKSQTINNVVQPIENIPVIPTEKPTPIEGDITPPQMRELAQMEYLGAPKSAVEKYIKTLQDQGLHSVNAYHGTKPDFIDSIMENGIKTGGTWYERNPSVYFLTDPKEMIEAMNFLSMNFEGAEGNIAIVKFNIPVEYLNQLKEDNLFNGSFDVTSAWRIENPVPPEWIEHINTYHVSPPSQPGGKPTIKRVNEADKPKTVIRNGYTLFVISPKKLKGKE